MANLYQVILVAKDVRKLATFYRDVIGLPMTYPDTDRELASENWATLDAGNCILAVHGGGEIRTSGAAILSLQVEDLDYRCFDLKQRGIDVDPIFEVAPGVRSAKLRDPEGNRLSLEQLCPAS